MNKLPNASILTRPPKRTTQAIEQLGPLLSPLEEERPYVETPAGP